MALGRLDAACLSESKTTYECKGQGENENNAMSLIEFIQNLTRWNSIQLTFKNDDTKKEIMKMKKKKKLYRDWRMH